jgi:hypothetical protein
VDGVLSRGRSSGHDVSLFDVRRDGDRVRVLNRRNELLVDLDDRRDVGIWRMSRIDGRARDGAPAFCRSGAGHPVWGRQWCLDKGFGLGSRAGVSWSRTSIGDIIFGRRGTYDRLDRGGLLDVLGDVVFSRLALQALALGLDAPLTGYWVAEPSGPALLRVRSGDYEVAEFYDYDRNDRPESLYVVVPLF